MLLVILALNVAGKVLALSHWINAWLKCPSVGGTRRRESVQATAISGQIPDIPFYKSALISERISNQSGGENSGL